MTFAHTGYVHIALQYKCLAIHGSRQRRNGAAPAPPVRLQPEGSCPAVALQTGTNCRRTAGHVSAIGRRRDGGGTVEGRRRDDGLAKSLIIMIVRINNNGYFCGLKLMEKNYATI